MVSSLAILSESGQDTALRNGYIASSLHEFLGRTSAQMANDRSRMPVVVDDEALE